MNTFLCLSADGWTAVGTVAIALATFLLAWVAWWQATQIREEAKLNRTIAACERYDLDPVLDRARRNILRPVRTGDLVKDPRPYEADIFTILNFLEQLAIGSNKGVYDRGTLCDYLKEIATEHVVELLDSGAADKLDIEPENFSEIRKLCREWAETGAP